MKRAFFSGIAAALLASAAWAGRPLTVDDAEPVAKGTFELEAGALYVKDGSVDHLDIPFGLTCGLIENVEAGIGFGMQWERRDELLGGDDDVDGLADLVVALKWKFLTEDQAFADQALAFSVKFPTADENDELGSGKTDYSLTWIASKPITDKLNLHANVGYFWIGDPADENLDNILFYGVAADWQLTETLQPVLEIFAETPDGDFDETAVLINGGIRWTVLENLVLDAAAGTGIRGDAPDLLVTLGVTWSF